MRGRGVRGWPLLHGLLVAVLWLLMAGVALEVRAGVPTVMPLDDRDQSLDPWPGVRVLFDDAARLTPDEARARQPEAIVPTGPRANFGEYGGALWLFFAIEVRPAAAGPWLLDIGYPPLDWIDLWLRHDDGTQVRMRNGDRLLPHERPLRTRTHVMPLDLKPGRYQLMLRVQTTGSLIAPLALVTPVRHHAHEERLQVILGLAAGVMLSLFLYSLAQWYSLRDRMFAFYGLSVFSLGLFQFAFHGLGMQHVWGDWLVLSERLPPVCVLIGIAGAFLFIDRALGIAEMAPRLSRLMRLGAVICLVATVGVLAGVLSYRDGQRVSKVMGQLPTVLALPIAWRRWRLGDRAAGYLLLGWGVYTGGVMVLALLISGRLPITPLTLHGFQIASITEMIMWMVVTGIRVDSLRRAAEQVRHDGEQLRRLADTDALTGLLNRRGLLAAGPVRVEAAEARPGHLAAIYLLDLDGFKPVNDRFGHHVGDAVLVQVAQRLHTQVRAGDLVARLGGDEFVVLVTGLHDDAAARRVGTKLLQALAQPIELPDRTGCRIGATIGYALAPEDGRDIARLLECADQAMYAGKQSGKQQIRRVVAATEAAT